MQIAGEADSLSKHKCRAYWTCKVDAALNHPLADEWIEEDAIREIEPDLFSRPGLFSWDLVDPGS